MWSHIHKIKSIIFIILSINVITFGLTQSDYIKRLLLVVSKDLFAEVWKSLCRQSEPIDQSKLRTWYFFPQLSPVQHQQMDNFQKMQFLWDLANIQQPKNEFVDNFIIKFQIIQFGKLG